MEAEWRGRGQVREVNVAALAMTAIGEVGGRSSGLASVPGSFRRVAPLHAYKSATLHSFLLFHNNTSHELQQISKVPPVTV